MIRTKRSIGSFYRFACLLAGCALLSTSTTLSAQTCGENFPTFPTPQFQGSVSLWPSNFQPARPGEQLPLVRDSSQYKSTTYPSAATGHELFWALSAVDSWLFVAYNVGVSVWDASGVNAEDPQRVHYRDGIAGQWLFHPPPGESDGYIHDIDAIADPNNSDTVIVAIAATSPVGVSIWKFSRAAQQIFPVYQQTTKESTDVDLVNFNGTVYALFAATGGAFVFDASAASQLTGCLDTACPGSIYRGRVGTSLGSRYVSGIVKNGLLYSMQSYGGIAPSSPLPELWEMSDPSAPLTAQRRFLGTIKDTHSATLFKKGSAHYMAAVENKHLKIYPFDSCLSTTGCAVLPTASFDNTLRNQNWLYNFLTFSESNGVPFIYYGCDCNFLSGDAVERLFDLSNLGGSNAISEITATGSTYSDNDLPSNPCTTTHTNVGYWSHQYSSNRYGYRNWDPRKGVFIGNYFYRVTQTTLDVHRRGAITQIPSVTAATSSTPPYWFGEPVNFTATSQNCAGSESWTWFTDPYTFGVGGTGPNDATASLTWNLCTSGDCSSFSTDVWAVKTACSGAPDLDVNSVSVTLNDPRPHIRSMTVAPVGSPPDTFPLCSVLNFGATIDGKSPFTYQWTAYAPNGEPLHTGNSSTFSWDTEGITLSPDLFDADFETGDLSQWGGSTGGPSLAPKGPSVADIVHASGGVAIFNVELVATNPNSQQDTETRPITLIELGLLQFGVPQIIATNQGNGEYRFVANTLFATSWRWEFADPANGTAGACQVLPAAKCTVIQAGADDNDVTYRWLPTNTDGPYGVAVIADNCQAEPISSSSSFTVNVTGITAPNPPSITEFRVNPTAWDPGDICDPDSVVNSSYFCKINQAVPFIIGSTNATHIQIDWDRNDVYEIEVAVGATITKTWTEVGPLLTGKPRVRARSGANLSSPVDLVKPMSIVP